MAKRERRIHVRAVILALIFPLIAFSSRPSIAQIAPEHHPNTDENGVDLTSGSFNITFPLGSIGQGPGSIALARSYGVAGRVDNWTGVAAKYNLDGVEYVHVTMNGSSSKFKLVSSNWVSVSGDGVSWNDATATFTDKDGTEIEFSSIIGDGGGRFGYCDTDKGFIDCLQPQILTKPNGERYFFVSQTVESRCEEDGDEGCYYRGWVSYVSSNTGYEAGGGSYDSTYSLAPPVELSNLADSSAPLLSMSQSFSLTVDQFTDASGGVWRVTKDGLGRVASVRTPGNIADNITVSYGSAGVSSVTKDGLTTQYNRVVAGTTGTMTVTYANSTQKIVVSDLSINRPTSITDENGRVTAFSYDLSGRLLRKIYPEGNQATYTYDSRGNVLESREISKTPGTPPDVVSSASYPSACTNPKTCNQPTFSIDTRGKRTDFTYDAVHGGILTATYPADSNGVRPQMRYAYMAYQAYYRDYNGNIIASGYPIYLLSGTSSCRTSITCSGSGDETKTSIGYGPQTSGVPNNLLPVSSSVSSGDGALTATTVATYDATGNRVAFDGPLSGTSDTVHYRYDANRRLVGVISPDPDGAGPLKRRARKMVYDSGGRITETISGTVTGTDDPSWTALSVAEKVTSTWTNGRKVKDVLSSGSTTYAVTQYSYDSVGRVECAVQRMNSAVWGSLPSSACSLGTTGPFGPDRITKTTYDAASRVTKIQTGYAVGGIQADEVTTAYTANGRVATVIDASGNKTTYEYDGFDRLKKMRYPHPSNIGTSSTTDYEELTYDTGSNVTIRRLRDGNSINYTYDNLSRVTAKDLPGAEPDVTYVYNLFGQMTGASQSGNALTFGFDALGRNTSQAGPHGITSYVYDLAGNRIRTTWPGGTFYVDYERLVTGEVAKVRENGATSGAGVLVTYAYDDLGRRTTLTRGNGVVTSYGYDAVSRLNSLTHNLASTGNDVTTTFTYNPAGQIVNQVGSNANYNWTGAVNATRSYGVNGLNQYANAGGVSFSYDAKGNLTASGSDTYTYSSENLIKTGPGSVSLTYDPMLRLYQTSAAARRFAYDGGNIIAEYNLSNVLQARHVFGPGTDEALVSYDASGNRSWLVADERRSIVAKTDGSGAATAIRAYDEYGIPSGADVGRFQYTGQVWLPELGMSYYKARMYSATMGRFMQPDPVGYSDGMNLYTYVQNDPINMTDPSGLCGSWGSDQEHDDVVVCGSRPNEFLEQDGSDYEVVVTGRHIRRRRTIKVGSVTYVNLKELPEDLTIDKSCANTPIVNDPKAQQLMQEALKRSLRSNLSNGREEWGFWGADAFGGGYSYGELFTDKITNQIDAYSRQRGHVRSWLNGHYKQRFFFHTHPNSLTGSRVSGRDIEVVRQLGATAITVDRRGTVTCGR